MIETIVGFVVVSGLLGVVANILVSALKKLRKLGIKYAGVFTPRTWAALSSLSLVVASVLMGGEVDVNEVTQYLEVLAYAAGTWLTAHVIHKTNKI